MHKKNKNVKEQRACGTWPSPVTSELLSGKVNRYSTLRSAEGKLYWLERCFEQGGRTLLKCYTPQTGRISSVFSPQVTIGTSVHEYGGGGYAVSKDAVACVCKDTGDVKLRVDGKREQTVVSGQNRRFADLCFDKKTSALFAVCEDHSSLVEGGAQEPKNMLVLIADFCPQNGKIVQEGADFYMDLSLSPDGQWLSWIEWDHPFMPWDGTRLCMARLRRDEQCRPQGLEAKKILADGLQKEPVSYTQPRWGGDGSLFVLSEKGEFSGLWVCDPFAAQVELTPYFTPEHAEIGQPSWVFGQCSYQLLPDDGCIAVLTRRGEERVYIRYADGHTRRFYGWSHDCPQPLGEGTYGWIELSQSTYPRIVVGEGRKDGCDKVIAAPKAPALPKGDISRARDIHFPVKSQPGLTGQAYFYLPQNENFCPAPSEKPPMIVQVHGGPTGCVQDNFSLKVQKWTTRGFAVLDVNYGGSTGFGRSWRRRLLGQWGVVDVQDCIDAARFMITTGLIDPRRIAIRGSSSGGMSVFLALATSPLFAGGVSAYGVTDLCGLQEDTHKFESHYNDSLIGQWPQAKDLYVQRSPLTVAQNINVPVLLLHGDKDKVVPLSQAYAMAEKLREAGVPHKLKKYAGAGHGFRQPETVKDAFEEELAFYRRIFHCEAP